MHENAYFEDDTKIHTLYKHNLMHSDCINVGWVFLKIFIYFIFRDRGKGGERERCISQ